MSDKLAALLLTPELFVEFTKASQNHASTPRRFVVIENPLPDDAKVVDVGHDGPNLKLIITSQSFVEVDGLIPTLPSPIYRSVFDEPQPSEQTLRGEQ